jgi:hypothetical protein
MKRMFVGFAAIAMFVGACNVYADTTVYSFETVDGAGHPDGFSPNGGGITVTQDTFGATDLLHSMKTSVVTGATFVGALTTVVNPLINNPPGVDAVKFDLTIGPNDAFTGGFDVIGVTVFGFNAGLGQFGLQAQFAPLIHVEGKVPGTYLDQLIPLTGATNPLDFTTNQTFNQIFGPGANQLTPSGFEFFINKSNDAPTTLYFDNVRIITSVPEPATCTLVGLAMVGLVGSIRRRTRQI